MGEIFAGVVEERAGRWCEVCAAPQLQVVASAAGRRGGGEPERRGKDGGLWVGGGLSSLGGREMACVSLGERAAAVHSLLTFVIDRKNVKRTMPQVK